MPGSLDPMRAELRRRAQATARAVAAEWEAELRKTSPVDSGNMRQQTDVRARPTASGAEIEATVDTDYAAFVSGGTRPHVITPRSNNPRARLRFVGRDGAVVYARRVNHPGQQPNRWWDDAQRRLPDMLRRAWRIT